MADNENIVVIPLRRTREISRRRRSNMAITLIRLEIARKFRIPLKNVWVDPKLNETIWKRGIENPPRRVKVKIVKFPEEDYVEVYNP